MSSKGPIQAVAVLMPLWHHLPYQIHHGMTVSAAQGSPCCMPAGARQQNSMCQILPIWHLTPCLSTGNSKMVSISPFVNKMFYSRLFTASLLRQKAWGHLSGGVSWVVGHCTQVIHLIPKTLIQIYSFQPLTRTIFNIGQPCNNYHICMSIANLQDPDCLLHWVAKGLRN